MFFETVKVSGGIFFCSAFLVVHQKRLGPVSSNHRMRTRAVLKKAKEMVFPLSGFIVKS